MAVNLTTAQVIYAAQSRLLELADIVEQSVSFRRVKNEIKIGEALIRYIRVLQTDASLTLDEQTAICQHMIHIGNLYDFPASPTITSNEIFNFSAGAQTGPKGDKGDPGQDGGGTDYNQFALTTTTDVDTFDVTDADGAEWSYKIKDGSNLRAGRITAVWLVDGSSIRSAEYSTMDIGDTSPVTFSVVYSAGTIGLRATIASGTWDINGTRYFIPNNGAGVTVENTVLATGKILIGNASNEAAPQTVSGDITLNSSGQAAISTGVIVNSDISSSAAIGMAKLAALSPSAAVVTNASGVLVSSATVSDTELGYLANVTSDIQAQLDSKIGSVTGAISTVVSANLTPNRAVISNSAGKIAIHSATTDTHLGYISTLSSNAQTQLNSKLNLSGGTLTGTLTAQEISLNTNFNINLFGTGSVFLDTGQFTTNGSAYFVGGFRTDVSGVYYKIKTINIGDWNMDLNSTVTVAHGLVDYKKIRSVQFTIRDDADNLYYSNTNLATDGTVHVAVNNFTSTNIILLRKDTGIFDNTSFDSTAYNRGWITILYEA